MHLLKSIEINNFRESHAKKISFFRDINFLIGENGSGKTTVLKIILGLLTGNIRLLFSLPFKNACIVLSDFNDRFSNDILIKVKKHPDSLEFAYGKIHDTLKTLKIDSNDERLFRERPYRRLGFFFPSERSERERYNHLLIRKEFREFGDFDEFIKNFVSFTDLSVERLSFSNSHEKDTSIDNILKDVMKELGEYFKDLSLKASQEDNLLKETYVMSLLTPQRDKDNKVSLSSDKMEEKLKNIFKTLGLKKQPQKELNEFLKNYRNEEQNGRLGSDSIRMKKIIAMYDEIEEKKQEIFKPKYIFLDVLNRLLHNKEIVYQENVNEQNETLFVRQSKIHIDLAALSSGEKHLLIFLGKTLLQKNAPKIFIADEPEISLHIQWQRQLVNAIRLLNENAQIVFATHSPEIVAGYSDRLHNLSEKK